jgi:endonuclease YncB( thermonuclease family)
MGCPLRSTRIGHPGGSRRPRPTKVSIIIAGTFVVLAIIIVAFFGGAGGALVFLAAATALAGLYILTTGQRPWARVLRGPKAGAVFLVASLVLFIAGTLSLPRTDVADPSAASHGNQDANPANDAPDSCNPECPLPATRPTGTDGPYPVLSVTDGDTIRVCVDGKSTRIRLIGIDTPEVRDPRKPVQCFGREASRRAHELMDGTQVWLEYDPSQGRRDRYGRTLAYVWLNENMLVNQQMVSEGFAHEYTYDDSYKYRDTFRHAEQAAQTAELGLWNPATCAGNTQLQTQ